MIDEHQAILNALQSRDQLLAQATALVHVNTSEAWLRRMLNHPSPNRVHS